MGSKVIKSPAVAEDAGEAVTTPLKPSSERSNHYAR
jgi:hypothetical protein